MVQRVLDLPKYKESFQGPVPLFAIHPKCPGRFFTFWLCASQAQTPAFHIRYDHDALRIPGNKFSITLVSSDKKSQSWGKYHVEVDSGHFTGGAVQLNESNVYKKQDSVTVSVYTRKVPESRAW
jgi:hypothetical protein